MSKWLNRDLLARALVVALVVGIVAWLASCTEWVDVDVPLPARGEAAKNHLYATQQLVRRLGATVATPHDLSQLPPPRATLLLTSWYWDLFPERVQRLKSWVDSGGHLVIYAGSMTHEQLRDWLPIKRLDPARKASKDDKKGDADADADDDSDDDDDTKAKPVAAPASAPRIFGSNEPPCRDAVEPDSVMPAYADGSRHFRICAYANTGWKLQSVSAALWSLDGPSGPLMLRAARGKGEVTVILPWALLDNDRVLKGDNSLAAVAALQARPGADVWFIAEEARPPFLKWLWQEAWVAVLLGATALALVLWRGARRFGPLMATPAEGRRSMAEQISGTAQFLRRRGPEALLAAQIRALETVARSHLRQYDKLDRIQRATAIGQATGLDAAALGLALDKSLARRRVDLPATLELLETARRLLAQRERSPRK
ncbi:MAG: DUF4350 domain-containing protein [Rhizobacter sp.]